MLSEKEFDRGVGEAGVVWKDTKDRNKVAAVLAKHNIPLAAASVVCNDDLNMFEVVHKMDFLRRTGNLPPPGA